MAWKKRLKLPGLYSVDIVPLLTTAVFFFVLQVFVRLSASRRQYSSEAKRNARFGREQEKKEAQHYGKWSHDLDRPLGRGQRGQHGRGRTATNRNRNRDRDRRTRLPIAALAASALF